MEEKSSIFNINFMIYHLVRNIFFSMATEMSRSDPNPTGSIINWPQLSGSVILRICGSGSERYIFYASENCREHHGSTYNHPLVSQHTDNGNLSSLPCRLSCCNKNVVSADEYTNNIVFLTCWWYLTEVVYSPQLWAEDCYCFFKTSQ